MIFVQLLFSLFCLEDFNLAMKLFLAKAAWIYQNGHQLSSQPSYPSLFPSPLNIGKVFRGIALHSHWKRQKSMRTWFDFLPNMPHFHAKFHITIKPMIDCGNWNQTSCHPGFQNEVMGVAVKTPRIRAGGFYFSHGCAACSCTLCVQILWLCRSCTQLDKTPMLTQATKVQQQQENKKANYQDCVHEKCTFN